MKTNYYILFSMAFILFTGCATGTKHKNVAETFVFPKEATPVLQAYQPITVAEGSLWSEARGLDLFPDKRARKTGDIVIVRIVEDPEAQLNANTSTSRSSGVSASQLKFLGYMQALAESNKRLAQNPGTDDLISSALGMTFDGEGSSDRNGHIKAYVSATVEMVLPNGNLYIKGKREIRVNHETQYITLSGVIRPEDISPENEISSTYVADARIGYAGLGPIADKQKPGWLGRVVDHVWPF
jgi:flagellar L-ring protein precursor FlgH